MWLPNMTIVTQEYRPAGMIRLVLKIMIRNDKCQLAGCYTGLILNQQTTKDFIYTDFG